MRYSVATLLCLCIFALISKLPLTTAREQDSDNNSFQKGSVMITNKDATKWPNLVGQSGQEAMASLLKLHPDWTIQILPQDSMVTMDYREDRVRIFVDENDKVVRTPMVG